MLVLLAACASSLDGHGDAVGVATGEAAAAIEITDVVEDHDNGHANAILDRRPCLSRFANACANRTASDRLVTISTAEEQAWVEANRSAGFCWIGARQNPASPAVSEPAAGWEWVSGETWDYTDWGSGEPSECCGGEEWLMTFDSREWNDNYYNRNYVPGCDGIVVEFESGIRAVWPYTTGEGGVRAVWGGRLESQSGHPSGPASTRCGRRSDSSRV